LALPFFKLQLLQPPADTSVANLANFWRPDIRIPGKLVVATDRTLMGRRVAVRLQLLCHIKLPPIIWTGIDSAFDYDAGVRGRRMSIRVGQQMRSDQDRHDRRQTTDRRSQAEGTRFEGLN
jgi:hypothetical protein